MQLSVADVQVLEGYISLAKKNQRRKSLQANYSALEDDLESRREENCSLKRSMSLTDLRYDATGHGLAGLKAFERRTS